VRSIEQAENDTVTRRDAVAAQRSGNPHHIIGKLFVCDNGIAEVNSRSRVTA